MKITILTMFPELFAGFLDGPIPRRAKEKGIAQIRLIDIRDYAGGCYRHIDDSTYGGGAGMVLRAQPVLDALKEAMRAEDGASLYPPDASVCNATDTDNSPDASSCDETDADDGTGAPPGAAGGISLRTLVAAMTPVGWPYRQETAARYARLDHLILLCGHYEGLDERIYARVDERISIGDYVLSGGELAAQVVADSVLRLLPGVLRQESTADESFCGRGLLEYPQYTRPAVLGERDAPGSAGNGGRADGRPKEADGASGRRVPEVLLSGNHEEIRRWRLRESLRATLRWRPDILEHMELTQEEMALLEEIRSERAGSGEPF